MGDRCCYDPLSEYLALAIANVMGETASLRVDGGRVTATFDSGIVVTLLDHPYNALRWIAAYYAGIGALERLGAVSPLDAMAYTIDVLKDLAARGTRDE